MRIAHSTSFKTRSDYQGCNVQQLSRGSVNVDYILYFEKDADISVTDLQDVLNNYDEVINITSNTGIVFKSDSISIEGICYLCCPLTNNHKLLSQKVHEFKVSTSDTI